MTRRTTLTFLLGSALGFCTTYLFVMIKRTDYLYNSKSPYISQQFIHNSPHSHGETNNFVGPETEQHWNDFDSDDHKRNFIKYSLYYSFILIALVLFNISYSNTSL